MTVTHKMAAPPLLEGESVDQLELMRAGKPYLAVDSYLVRQRDASADRLARVNEVRNTPERMTLYEGFIHLSNPKSAFIMTPFMLEYGFNISIGQDVYIAPNCTFIDVCPIVIGDRTMIGANSSLYTPSHPLSPEERNGLSGPEFAKPITIGTDCWLGGSVIVLPGVTIGDGCTIGAGSVVTKDVPPRSVAVGNPARVIKKILADGTTVPVGGKS